MVLSCNNANVKVKNIEFNANFGNDTPSLIDSFKHTSKFNYNLKSVIKTIIPPKELDEISGLTYDPISNTLFCINDEQARLYSINIKTGRIESKYKFGKSGDYEGIELVDSIVYILKSNGQLYPFNLSNKKPLDKIKTPLSSANDLEGLGLSHDKSTLLLACKGNPEIKNYAKGKTKKSIYSYNLIDNKFNKKALFHIYHDDLISWLEKDNKFNYLSNSKQKKLIRRLKKFSPSGIACHPVSKQYYILSSQGKLLICVENDYKIYHIEFLTDSHAQAEGICFDSKANLYISNEARGLTPKIFVYKQIDNSIN